MACSWVLLPRAQSDYEGIVRYLARDLASPGAARHFMDEFDEKVEAVCQRPETCVLSRMPELARLGYRPMPVMRYVALYTVRDGVVVIAHVFRASREYARYV